MTLKKLLEDIKLSAVDNIIIYTVWGYDSAGGYRCFEDEVYCRHGGYSIYETLDKEYLDYKVVSIKTTEIGELKIRIEKEK